MHQYQFNKRRRLLRESLASSSSCLFEQFLSFSLLTTFFLDRLTPRKRKSIILSNTGSLLVKTISNFSSCRLINDTHHIKTSNNTSILGSLTLRIRKVSRDSKVTTAFLTVEPRYASAISRIFMRTIEEFSSELLLLNLIINNFHGLVTRSRNDLERPQIYTTLNRSA